MSSLSKKIKKALRKKETPLTTAVQDVQELSTAATVLKFVEIAEQARDGKIQFLISRLATVQDLQEIDSIQKSLVVIWLEDK